MSVASSTTLGSVLPIVLGYSRFASTTALCLDTLLPQAQDLDLVVRVIDNGSPDDSAALLSQYALATRYQDHLRVSLNAENLGFGGGMNAAVAFDIERNTQQSGWILLINSDTLFPIHALKSWLTALTNAPQDVGLVGALTNNAGNAQKIILNHPIRDSLEQDFTAWAGAAERWMLQPTGLLWDIQRADFFCVAIRTHVWQQLKGLDRAYGRGYYEDFDFSVRAAAAGFRSVLTEDCFIYHQGSASFKVDLAQKELIRRNKALLLARFPDLALPHTRQDNLKLLEDQWLWLTSQQASQDRAFDDFHALRERMSLRWQAALKDVPRSPIKRWLWHRRLAKLQQHFTI